MILYDGALPIDLSEYEVALDHEHVAKRQWELSRVVEEECRKRYEAATKRVLRLEGWSREEEN